MGLVFVHTSVLSCIHGPVSGKHRSHDFDFDSGLESWLSSQEVLFLSFFYKQWKRGLEEYVPDSLFPL